MNERLTLQDLIDLLSEKQGITKKDAEAFIRELVDLVTETISGKDFVRVKDFGTFKLTPVKARKSVDVNTGEDIEIAAHYKLSFSPDKVLREIVNRPFAHFESIILEDEVVFEEKTDPKKKKTPEKESAKEVVKAKEEIADIPQHETEEKAVEAVVLPINTPEKEETIVERIETVNIDSLSPAAETIEEMKVEPFAASGRTSVHEVKPEPEAVYFQSMEKDEYDDEEEEDDDDDSYENDYEEYLRQQKRKQNIWIGIGLAVVLLLGIGYWGYSGYSVEKEINDVPLAQNNHGITISEKEDVNIGAAETNESIEPEESKPELTTTSETTETKPVTKEPGGKVIEIQQGETMRSLGTKYYGYKAFWVYIFEENREVISRPDAIQAGMKVTLPDPSKYGIDANDPQSRRKADRYEMKLFGEFSDE